MGKPQAPLPLSPAHPHLAGHLGGPLLVGDAACPAKLAPCMATARRDRVRGASEKGVLQPATTLCHAPT
jgi:hypothetical protein